MSRLLGAFLSRVTARNSGRLDPVQYWQRRSAQFGRNAVLDLRHSSDTYESVTHRQCEQTFPYLTAALTGKEKIVLDLGCGPGRFTQKLASVTGARAIGVDPIQRFVDIAPRYVNVQYRVMLDGRLPLDSQSVDLVWIHLVLGGVAGAALDQLVAEVDRVLKERGLVCLIENTSRLPSPAHWTYRSAQQYQRLFHFVDLVNVNSYQDLGEDITVLIGNRRVRPRQS